MVPELFSLVMCSLARLRVSHSYEVVSAYYKRISKRNVTCLLLDVTLIHAPELRVEAMVG